MGTKTDELSLDTRAAVWLGSFVTEKGAIGQELMAKWFCRGKKICYLCKANGYHVSTLVAESPAKH